MTSDGFRANTVPASAILAASLALLVGGLYAAVSGYWGLGGTALLDTVGGAFQRAGREGSAGLIVLVWITVVLKMLAALLGLVAVAGHRSLAVRRRRLVRQAGWAAALILVAYGGLLSLTGWLVQLGIVSAAKNADQKALRWHAYLRDPWFLVWGLLLATGLALSRQAGPNRQLSTLRGDQATDKRL